LKRECSRSYMTDEKINIDQKDHQKYQVIF